VQPENERTERKKKRFEMRSEVGQEEKEKKKKRKKKLKVMGRWIMIRKKKKGES
jgi:hypothetical protein